jgi:sulfate adenylyltransferase
VSGTQLRQWLAEGADVPPEFSRPEVLAILREYYAALDVARKPAGTSATQPAR